MGSGDAFGVDEIANEKTYSTRGNANRAARDACKKLLGKSFCAYEGPDYEIHPVSDVYAMPWEVRYFFRLRGAWLADIAA